MTEKARGRPRLGDKKIPVSMKLPPWIVDWIRSQPKSAAVLVEDALVKTHKLKHPKQ